MKLKYKEDWEQVKERYSAWWQGENTGRCGLAVTAIRQEAKDIPQPAQPDTPFERWTNLDHLSELCEWSHRRTFYGGEAFPMWHGGWPYYADHPAFLGCRVELNYDTGWVEPHPALAGEKIDWQALQIDESNPNLQFQLALVRRGVEEARGKSVPVIGTLGSTGDTLAALRGTERLLYDLIDRPEEVRAAELYLVEQQRGLYDRFYEITYPVAEGSACWLGLWAPGKLYAVQNDFAYMISPKMYEDLFLPALQKRLEFLDYAVYHVDGVRNFVHVDMLCELENLQALQIGPGDSKPSPLHYMTVLKKVQAAGKNLHIGIQPNEVRSALRELSAKGLFIITFCRTEDEAKDLLRKAEKWSKEHTSVFFGPETLQNQSQL